MSYKGQLEAVDISTKGKGIVASTSSSSKKQLLVFFMYMKLIKIC